MTTSASIWIILVATIGVAQAAMPVDQENALTAKYCAVCHDDAHKNGGLSLQHFDASHLDPSLAAMLASKIRTGAVGAAGLPGPGPAIEKEWVDALVRQSTGSLSWTLTKAADQSAVSASIVRDAKSLQFPEEPDLYRLIVTCRPGTQQGELLLAWAPATPKSGQAMSVSWDGKMTFSQTIEGTEVMGNTGTGSSGPGSIVLKGSSAASSRLPDRSLTVSNVFPNESITFPFNDLPAEARHSLAPCFGPQPAQ